MKINYLTKNYTAKDNLKEIIAKKIERLDKYFADHTDIKVKLKEEGGYFKLELTIIMGSVVLRSEVVSDDMYKNIDLALPKLEKQVSRHFGKLEDKYKRASAIPAEFAELPVAEAKVVRTKELSLPPITVKQALIEIDRIEHDFYVFHNADTKKVNVIYKRKGGEYGIIECNLEGVSKTK